MLMWRTIDDTVYACPAPVHRDNVLDLKTLSAKSYTEEMPRRWIIADTTSGKTIPNLSRVYKWVGFLGCNTDY